VGLKVMASLAPLAGKAWLLAGAAFSQPDASLKYAVESRVDSSQVRWRETKEWDVLVAASPPGVSGWLLTPRLQAEQAGFP